ncbi:putative cilia- and flagella-associated protein 43 [Blattamonas nauphoetae]|uniref:Cilia- and flagella-associated protein 43 n=1 Tax=Blattamonas nauphoetae TaxID=2049346 RepID=A0ABQ9YG46_9EUKA|nr:putative cilia- and flagella-associated protein 43 [Blattamonas nauphoetae]
MDPAALSFSLGANSHPQFLENKLIYLAGNSVCISNIKERTRRHIWGLSFGLSTFAVSKSFFHIAVASRDANPTITIIRYKDNTVQQTLPGTPLIPFSRLAFSRDGDYLASVSAVPEAKLSVWEWNRDGEPLLCSYYLNKEFPPHKISSLSLTVDSQFEHPTSAQSQRDSGISNKPQTSNPFDVASDPPAWFDVSFDPSDPHTVCVIAPRHVFIMTFEEQELTCLMRPHVSVLPNTFADITSHAWLPHQEGLVFGTADGHILHYILPHLLEDPTISTFREVKRLTNQDSVTALIVTRFGLAAGTEKGTLMFMKLPSMKIINKVQVEEQALQTEREQNISTNDGLIEATGIISMDCDITMRILLVNTTAGSTIFIPIEDLERSIEEEEEAPIGAEEENEWDDQNHRDSMKLTWDQLKINGMWKDFGQNDDDDNESTFDTSADSPTHIRFNQDNSNVRCLKVFSRHIGGIAGGVFLTHDLFVTAGKDDGTLRVWQTHNQASHDQYLVDTRMHLNRLASQLILNNLPQDEEEKLNNIPRDKHGNIVRGAMKNYFENHHHWYDEVGNPQTVTVLAQYSKTTPLPPYQDTPYFPNPLVTILQSGTFQDKDEASAYGEKPPQTDRTDEQTERQPDTTGRGEKEGDVVTGDDDISLAEFKDAQLAYASASGLLDEEGNVVVPPDHQAPIQLRFKNQNELAAAAGIVGVNENTDRRSQGRREMHIRPQQARSPDTGCLDVKEIALIHVNSPITAITICPGSSVVAVGTEAGSVRLYDMRALLPLSQPPDITDPKESDQQKSHQPEQAISQPPPMPNSQPPQLPTLLFRIRLFTSPVVCLSYSSFGEYIAASSDDNRLYLIDGRPRHDGPKKDVSFSLFGYVNLPFPALSLDWTSNGSSSFVLVSLSNGDLLRISPPPLDSLGQGDTSGDDTGGNEIPSFLMKKSIVHIDYPADSLATLPLPIAPIQSGTPAAGQQLHGRRGQTNAQQQALQNAKNQASQKHQAMFLSTLNEHTVFALTRDKFTRAYKFPLEMEEASDSSEAAFTGFYSCLGAFGGMEKNGTSNSIALSPDGKYVACTARDGQFFLHAVSMMAEQLGYHSNDPSAAPSSSSQAIPPITVFRPHDPFIGGGSSIRFSPTSTHAISTGYDGCAYGWQMPAKTQDKNQEQPNTTIAKAADRNATLTVVTPSDIFNMALQTGQAAIQNIPLPNPPPPKDLTPENQTTMYPFANQLILNPDEEEPLFFEAKQRNQERIEIQRYSSVNNELQQQINSIRSQLQAEIDANSKASDMEKLDRMDFVIDYETRDKLKKEMDKKAREVKQDVGREEITSAIQTLRLLALCTEDMEVPDTAITGFNHTEVAPVTDLEGEEEEEAVFASLPPLSVRNFALSKIKSEDVRRMDVIRRMRRMELLSFRDYSRDSLMRNLATARDKSTEEKPGPLNLKDQFAMNSHSMPIQHALGSSFSLVQQAYGNPNSPLYISSRDRAGKQDGEEGDDDKANEHIEWTATGIDEHSGFTGDIFTDHQKLADSGQNSLTIDQTLLYHPLQLTSTQRKLTQISLIQSIIRSEREMFNSMFNKLRKEKESTIQKVTTIQKQINSIHEQLAEGDRIEAERQAEQAEEKDGVKPPTVVQTQPPPSFTEYLKLHPLETPETMCDVSEEEVAEELVKRAVAAGATINLEETLGKTTSGEGQTASGGTLDEQSKQRALMEMMDGTLQEKSEENLLTMEIPREPWMDTVPQEKWTEEQKKAMAEYNKKKEIVQKYRKSRENELQLLAENARASLYQFDQKLEQLLVKRIEFSKRIFENQLWIAKLAESILTKENLTQKEEQQIRAEHEKLSAQKRIKNKQLLQTERDIEIIKAEINHLRERLKQVDADTRTELERMSKKMFPDKQSRQEGVAHLLSLYRMKQREGMEEEDDEIIDEQRMQHHQIWMAEELLGENRIGIQIIQQLVRGDAPEELDQSPALELTEEQHFEACRLVLEDLHDPFLLNDARLAEKGMHRQLAELSPQEDAAGIVNPDDANLWSHLNDMREQRLTVDVEIDELMKHLGQLNSHKAFLQQTLKNLEESQNDLKRQQLRVSEQTRYADIDLVVLVRLLQGQVEVPPQPCLTSYGDALVIDRQEILNLNHRLRQQAQHALQLLKHAGTINKSIHWRKWDIEATKMAIEDEANTITDFHMLRVTKELQEIVRTGEDTRSKKEADQLRKKGEHLKETYMKKMDEVYRQEKILERQIRAKEQENHQLTEQIHDVTVSVKQRRKVYEIQASRSAQDDKRGSDKRMTEIMTEGKMKLQAKEQKEAIDKLTAEVERLRRKTFSTFENVRGVQFGNVDQK